MQWQIINQIRSLKYVRLNQTSLRLVVFIDSSFVNNSDLFSQIEYVICLTDAIHANILHWSSIKCKKVIRSVLAAELFVMIYDFDVDLVLKSIFIKMLDNTFISLILTTDSKFLYDCLIRLSIIVEKSLMIDVMILYQFYERREITEMIWIHEINNSANSIIKIKSSTALETMIDINKINLNTIEWVKRTRETVNQSKRTRQKKWEILERWIKRMCFNFLERFECSYVSRYKDTMLHRV